jgi:hypothetical protein
MSGGFLKSWSKARADQRGFARSCSADDGYKTVLFDLKPERVDFVVAAKEISVIAVLKSP